MSNIKELHETISETISMIKMLKEHERIIWKDSQEALNVISALEAKLDAQDPNNSYKELIDNLKLLLVRITLAVSYNDPAFSIDSFVDSLTHTDCPEPPEPSKRPKPPANVLADG